MRCPLSYYNYLGWVRCTAPGRQVLLICCFLRRCSLRKRTRQLAEVDRYAVPLIVQITNVGGTQPVLMDGKKLGSGGSDFPTQSSELLPGPAAGPSARHTLSLRKLLRCSNLETFLN